MDRVADFIRSSAARIAELWEEEARRELPAPRSMSQPVLLDHLPEFLDGLADYIEGNIEQADRAFANLVEGHALQRLGYGVGMETLTREYSKLRLVILRASTHLACDPEQRDSMLRMHEGMDRAMNEAIHRFAARREEVRERFISILGHDLRDPLSTVRISANMLAANPAIKPEHRVIASRISRACNRMQRMINDVLDFARGHLGNGIPANPTPNDMGEICRAAADELGAANPQREIVVDTHGNLRGSFDRDRVHQALGNLISNAIHHTEGSIEIRAYEEDEHQAVITEVTSHGHAIPGELRKRIFDPFSQGDIAGPRHGLGLGLFIVQQIALAHGGTCDVVSDEKATTFAIRWPRVPGAERRNAAIG
ncbi:MAG TPA: HAMP domain-containing sensor histidine kinase [Kofleriaceae bacterium]|nr:HAMP domain-containing sensor histidine kinase [Kofleriaceae bacterium]